jgi:cytoskeletal protein CcmA (bactofilin family)
MADQLLPSVELTALLGRGTRFEGKLHFEGRVRIDGSFQGEIRSDGVLVMGEGSSVQAEIAVSTLIVKGGTLKGNVQAREAIELYVPAQVTGKLRAPQIFMDKGVQFSGECVISNPAGSNPGASNP